MSKEFKFEEHFEKMNEVISCKHCHKAFKSEKMFNLKKRLNRIHKINFENKNREQNVEPTTSKAYKTKNIKCNISKKLLIKSYVGLVTEEAASFNLLNSPSMRNIVDPICKAIENATNCKKTLRIVAGNIIMSISKECENRLLSLKIDSVTRLSRKILGVSAQYIKNDKVNSRILGMVELKGQNSSTSKSLATEILNVLDKFGINLSQIVSITSDNGSNMIKSTKILSHCLSEEDVFEIEDNEIYFEIISSMDISTQINVEEIQICRCAAHTAQLCALDTTKNANIKQYIISSRNIVKYLRKNSNGFKKVFEIKHIKLPQLDCPTRWGSTYTMIKDIKNAKEIIEPIESIKDKSSEENFTINEEFWEFINSYNLALNPLQISIIKFQEEKLHYGDFYAQWLRCKLLTSKLIDENDSNKECFLYKISTVLFNSIEKRSEKLLANNGLLACLYLDPRFHHTLQESQKREAIQYLKMLWVKLSSVCDVNSSNNFLTSAFSTEPKYGDEDSDVLDIFLKVFLADNNDTLDVDTKIEKLKLPLASASTNVLSYWKERKHSDPEIYALSNVCFAIPPTQVSVERAFSLLKLVLAENRNRLSQDTLEDILLVKLNPSFIHEAIDDVTLFEDTDE